MRALARALARWVCLEDEAAEANNMPMPTAPPESDIFDIGDEPEGEAECDDASGPVDVALHKQWLEQHHEKSYGWLWCKLCKKNVYGTRIISHMYSCILMTMCNHVLIPHIYSYMHVST